MPHIHDKIRRGESGDSERGSVASTILRHLHPAIDFHNQSQASQKLRNISIRRSFIIIRVADHRIYEIICAIVA